MVPAEATKSRRTTTFTWAQAFNGCPVREERVHEGNDSNYRLPLKRRLLSGRLSNNS